MKWDKDIFIKNCETLCKRNKINGEHFNEKVGLIGALSKWKKESPRKESLFKICDEFNCSMDWLITGIEPQVIDSKETETNYEKWLDDKEKIISRLEEENQTLKEKVEWLEGRFFCGIRAGEKDGSGKDKKRDLYRGFDFN